MAPLALGYDMDAKADAKLEIIPKGNQIAVITLISFGAFFFGASLWLDYVQRPYGLAVAGSAVFLVLGSVAWWVSHKNESLAASHPFEINIGEGESSVLIKSDARSLPEASYVQTVFAHWSTLIHRKRLPDADGMIDGRGVPISNTTADAKVITEAANALAEQQVQEAVKVLSENANQSPHIPPSPVVSVNDGHSTKDS